MLCFDAETNGRPCTQDANMLGLVLNHDVFIPTDSGESFCFWMVLKICPVINTLGKLVMSVGTRKKYMYLEPGYDSLRLLGFHKKIINIQIQRSIHKWFTAEQIFISFSSLPTAKSWRSHLIFLILKDGTSFVHGYEEISQPRFLREYSTLGPHAWPSGEGT